MVLTGRKLSAILLHALASHRVARCRALLIMDGAMRRIVCVVVHNLRASHDYIRLDAFLRVGHTRG